MRKFIMSLSTVACLGLAAVPVLGLTQAANAGEREPSVTISYGDLDLASPAQAAIFKARVSRAGEDLCRAKKSRGELLMPVRTCVAEVHRDVSRQLSNNQRKALAYAARAKSVEFAAQ